MRETLLHCERITWEAGTQPAAQTTHTQTHEIQSVRERKTHTQCVTSSSGLRCDCSKKLPKKGIIGVSGYFLASLSPTLCHMCVQVFCLTIKMTIRTRTRIAIKILIRIRLSMRMRMRVNIRVADETFSIRRIKENSAIATFGENVNEYDVDDDKEADEVRMIVQQKGWWW